MKPTIRRLRHRLQNRLRAWLGLPTLERQAIMEGEALRVDHQVHDLSNLLAELTLQLQEQCKMGVDVHFREQSKIVIISHLNGGQVRIISAYFPTVHDMEMAVQDLRRRYCAPEPIWDPPYGLPYNKERF